MKPAAELQSTRRMIEEQAKHQTARARAIAKSATWIAQRAAELPSAESEAIIAGALEASNRAEYLVDALRDLQEEIVAAAEASAAGGVV